MLPNVEQLLRKIYGNCALAKPSGVPQRKAGHIARNSSRSLLAYSRNADLQPRLLDTTLLFDGCIHA